MTRCRLAPWAWSLALAFAGLVGCNLFNPQGSSSSGDGDADALINEGDAAMRRRDFQGAWDAYSQVLAQDSSRSLAWHGLAKARVGLDALPITELIRKSQDLGSVQTGDSIPFMNETDSVKNRFYKPLLRLQGIISKFQRLDSLGRLDGAWPSSRLNTDLLIAANLGLLFKLSDLNRDTIIDARDNLLKGAFDSLGSGGIQPGAISADSFLVGADGKVDTTGAVDEQKVADFNNFLVGMDQDLAGNKALIEKMLPADTTVSTGTDTGSATTSKEEVSQQVSKFLDETGASISFWKMNDSTDNDGDGCIDEEVWGDKKDNDGDGLTDEDSRIGYIIPDSLRVPGMPFARGIEDGIRSDDWSFGALDTMIAARGIDDDARGFWTYGADLVRTRYWEGLTWVDQTRDSVYARVVAANPDKTPDENLYKTRLIIREQVRALPPRQRLVLGAARIGGCWSRILGGKP